MAGRMWGRTRKACNLLIYKGSWRRGRDSNPRSEQTDNGFQDRRIRPLCHLSGVRILSSAPHLCKKTRALAGEWALALEALERARNADAAAISA